MAETPILKLPNFSQVFKVFYDESYIGIKGVLIRQGIILHIIVKIEWY